ncbi:homoserine kinase [Deinococcus geothermalis DSM 11300]|uniref:Homoserine kinase n=1 Tax=Deinococcus geothermalis (strain DSM 11300 / CIP 105573 / AG-3a) TaxID=319795 RepID=Q1IW37_DEIGD|nr:homoserine kinase [Deinococcus geothermalis]ABF46547.1 homoserine kinase [Deinococcus geothermalis DSM 11300]
MTFTVRAPASSANLGPGFDSLGLSVPLFTTLRVTPQEVTEVVPLGPALAGTPADKSNYVYRAMQLAAKRAGRPLPPARVEIETEVPLARGLGSSAAALVAGIVAANELLGRPLDDEALLDVAAREEGHPDNVAPALFGGIVVATLDKLGTHYVRLEPPAHLGVTVLIPDFELSTSKARAVLPKEYSRADAVHALSHAALLAAALAQGRLDLLKHAMQDYIHQIWRAPLVPGLSDILEEAHRHGALGAALSGAGPTVLCFHDTRDKTDDLHRYLQGVLNKNGLTGRVLDLPIDTAGTVVEAAQCLPSADQGRHNPTGR